MEYNTSIMKKSEIISLLLVAAAIGALLIAYFVRNDLLKPWIFLLSVALLIASLNPTSSKSKSVLTPGGNRVARVVAYFFIGMMGLGFVGLLLAPFIPSADIGVFGTIIIYGLFLVQLVSWFSYFYPRRWMARRLRWMVGEAQMPISQTGTGKGKILYTKEDNDGVSYSYIPSESHFFITRVMYLNPARYEKEYEERKYQLQVRMQQTQISLAWGISDCVSCLSFEVSIRLDKQDAKKDNVCRIREVIVDLAKEDFNQHLFTRLILDDETVHLETFHYQIIKMVIASADGDVERYDVSEFPYQRSEHFSEIVSKLSEDNRLDKLQSGELITEDEFEQVWLNASSSI